MTSFGIAPLLAHVEEKKLRESRILFAVSPIPRRRMNQLRVPQDEPVVDIADAVHEIPIVRVREVVLAVRLSIIRGPSRGSSRSGHRAAPEARSRFDIGPPKTA